MLDKCLAPTAGGEGCDNMTMILVQFKKPLDHGTSSKDHPLSCDQQAESDKDQAEIESSQHHANMESSQD